MAESFLISGASKAERYQSLYPQLKALWEDEPDLIANMANTTAVLKTAFDFHWVGFYLVKDQQLVLGPFQGPVACTRINFGKGVCGSSWEAGKSILVPDVDQFPGHIACSALSRSEVVVPVKTEVGKVVAVLDVDSAEVNYFDETDREWLEKIAGQLAMFAAPNSHSSSL